MQFAYTDLLLMMHGQLGYGASNACECLLAEQLLLV
jgi:hypothetical protein